MTGKASSGAGCGDRDLREDEAAEREREGGHLGGRIPRLCTRMWGVRYEVKERKGDRASAMR